MSADPFATAALRRRVLQSWAAAPTRLREDANAEQDYALGGYRDRVLIELAQNAHDAAARAGVPGRLLLRLDDDTLRAANTGAPLDAAGVQALATLRASAKRGGEPTVGRFGVGFSAVLALSDEPAVVSTSGAVKFSAAATAQAVESLQIPELAAEIARRDGHLPVLRLPFDHPDAGYPPSGYDTEVVLPLRDLAAHELARRLLGELDEVTMLSLPSLAEIRIELAGRPERVLAQSPDRWHLWHIRGEFTEQQLADRPVEERHRPGWQLTWALPRQAGSPVADVIHAPTPTDEPLPWPAVLIAGFPLEPGRRHIAPGPATDALIDAAATGYADLLGRLAADGHPIWPWLPQGLPAGLIDATLRECVFRHLQERPVLVGVAGGLVTPSSATALEGSAGADAAVLAALAPAVPGLVAAPGAARAALRLLGVGITPLADAVEQLPLPPTPEGWRTRYDALAGLADDPQLREALATLPVPLYDGRVVRGPRGAVIARELPRDVLAQLGIRVVAEAAEHPLLLRLGAESVGPQTVLDRPEPAAAVAAARAAEADGDEAADGLVDAVMALVAALLPGFGDGELPETDSAAGGLPRGEPSDDELPLRGYLAELVLYDADGEPAPAAELMLPGSVAAELLDHELLGLVHPDLVRQWGIEVLRAVGVLSELRVLGGTAAVDRQRLADLPDWADYRETYGFEGEPELVAIADLDAIAPGAEPRLLEVIAASPALRRALVTPALPAGRAGSSPGVAMVGAVPSYSAWWLRRAWLGGAPWPDPAAGPELRQLLDPLPAAKAFLAEADPQLRAALGAVRHPTELTGDPGLVDQLLARLGDLPEAAAGESRAAALYATLAAWRLLAGLDPDLIDLDALADPPARLRALRGGSLVLVEADEVVVADQPFWLQRNDLAVVVAPPGQGDRLADLLDLPSARQRWAGVLDGDAVRVPVPDAVRQLLPQAAADWFEHDELTVDGVPVDWWVDPEGAVHAATLAGLARGLAWSNGAWPARHAIDELLNGPDPDGELIDALFG